MRIRQVGAHALLLDCTAPADTPEAVADIPEAALVEAWRAELWRRRERGDLIAVEIVPAARTVLLDGLPDPATTTEQLTRWAPAVAAAITRPHQANPGTNPKVAAQAHAAQAHAAQAHAAQAHAAQAHAAQAHAAQAHAAQAHAAQAHAAQAHAAQAHAAQAHAAQAHAAQAHAAHAGAHTQTHTHAAHTHAAHARAAYASARADDADARADIETDAGADNDARARGAAEFRDATAEDGSDDAADVFVPVTFDGPDLAAVAEHWGVDVPAVRHKLTSTRFRVAFCGFAPGFPYLTGLPAELALPRLATPRPRVPAGSVALAGPYAGIYPGASPGGWLLVGRTDLVLFDVAADPPARLGPGTTVRMVAA